MSLEDVLYSLAAIVHANINFFTVATIAVILATLLGDALDLVIYAISKPDKASPPRGWRSILSPNVVLAVLGADPANATAAGAAVLGFLGALGSGASYRDAAIVALAAIGTVNTGYLLGADRAKFAIVFAAIFKKPAPAPVAPATP